MIQFFKSEGHKFIPIEQIGDPCWINLTKPGKEEVAHLAADLSIPMDFLTDPLDVDERARIEIEDGVILIVVRIPKVEPSTSSIPFSTLPVGVILRNDIIITVCSENINELLGLENGKIKNFSKNNKNHFILNIFLRTSFSFLKCLKEINWKTVEAENQLHKAMKNKELIKLLNIEKSLVFFTTSLKSNELMMGRLQQMKILDMDNDDMELLEDVIIDNRQAIEMAKIYSNILSGMMDAFASIISNNLNVVLKLLTSLTIMLMIPNLIASIYGMNVPVPFQNNQHAFLIVVGICCSLSALAVVVFRKNKWF